MNQRMLMCRSIFQWESSRPAGLSLSPKRSVNEWDGPDFIINLLTRLDNQSTVFIM